jgi:hypothetical protein
VDLGHRLSVSELMPSSTIYPQSHRCAKKSSPLQDIVQKMPMLPHVALRSYPHGRSLTCLFHPIRGNLNNWPLILFLSPDDIIENSKQDNRSRHQNAIIHARSLDRGSGGEEAEEEDDDTEAHGKEVDRDAKYSRKMERAPNELARLTSIINVIP